MYCLHKQANALKYDGQIDRMMDRQTEWWTDRRTMEKWPLLQNTMSMLEHFMVTGSRSQGAQCWCHKHIKYQHIISYRSEATEKVSQLTEIKTNWQTRRQTDPNKHACNYVTHWHKNLVSKDVITMLKIVCTVDSHLEFAGDSWKIWHNKNLT